jgi:hypothetical protein
MASVESGFNAGEISKSEFALSHKTGIDFLYFFRRNPPAVRPELAVSPVERMIQ